jgi:hypothetical protein
MFGSVEVADEPVVLEEEPASVSPDLDSMFGSVEVADEPVVLEEEPASVSPDLDSMFGSVEVADEPVVLEEEPASVSPDLDSMFGSVEVADEPVILEEEPASVSSDLSSMLGSSETVDEPSVEISIVVPLISPDSVDDSLEETKEAPKPDEELPAMSAGNARYSILTGDNCALCTIKLEEGRIRVRGALIAAMDQSVSLTGDILTGKGLIWMGQGYLTPVVLNCKEGMTVRIDRLAARPDGVTHEACGIGSVPSLCRLKQNGNDNQILLFVSGRLKKITVSPGLRIRAACVVAADPQVLLSDDGSDFLSVTGKGTVIITG